MSLESEAGDWLRQKTDNRNGNSDMPGYQKSEMQNVVSVQSRKEYDERLDSIDKDGTTTEFEKMKLFTKNSYNGKIESTKHNREKYKKDLA